jgi:hypothetical protein
VSFIKIKNEGFSNLEGSYYNWLKNTYIGTIYIYIYIYIYMKKKWYHVFFGCAKWTPFHIFIYNFTFFSPYFLWIFLLFIFFFFFNALLPFYRK